MKNEGVTTSKVEMTTRKIPSISFLGLAIGAIGGSALLFLLGKKESANFIGQWAPTFLLLGLYNKLVKTFSGPYDEEQRLRHGDEASMLKERVVGAQRPVPSV